MTYPKIPQTISNPVNDNIQKLAALFPSALKDGELDIGALKQELGEFTETGPEKYELTWAGKQQAKQIAFEPIVGKTLQYVPEDSKQPETTENLFIEGDNLEVLKMLRQNYYGAVKMICIDPPYNTGNDFIYNDNFKMSRDESDMAQGDMSDLGERYTRNRKDHNRYHANWLNMIYPRLRVAKDLLREDGVIFINIDENELATLQIVLDEIFGKDHFVSNFIWQNKKGGGNDAKFCATEHEYISVYAKNIQSLPRLFESFSEKYAKRYKEEDESGRYFWDTFKRKSGKQYYAITCPDGTILEKDEYGNSLSWLRSEQRFINDVKKGEIKFEKRRDGWSVMFKQRMPEGKKPRSLLLNKGTTGDGSAEILELFGKNLFSNPKPLSLLIYLLGIGLKSNDIILDFFSGSATTAHAVMQLNAEDGGNRKYIMVQLPEPCDETSEAFKAGYKNICEIGKERIRRAGEKILEENKDKAGIENLDTGFKVFRVADTNINWLHQDLKGYDLFDHYDKNASDKDKLDFMPGFTDLDVVYEIMLRQTDIPLSSKVVRLSDIGQRTYMFADSFVVCLEQEITRELIDRLAAIEPLPVKFVFRDSAFDDNIALKDETFRRLNALIEKNSGGEKPAYTVEFI
jgi:adenine-specific DNA-methyltransferase